MAKMVPKEYHTTHCKMSWLRVCCSDVSPVISMIALIKFHSTGHYLCCTNPSGTLPSDVAERFKFPREKINMAANKPNWLQLRLTPSSCGAADGRKFHLSPKKISSNGTTMANWNGICPNTGSLLCKLSAQNLFIGELSRVYHFQVTLPCLVWDF